MKWLLALAAILSSSAALATENLYVYQARVPATPLGCEAESALLGQRFAMATGAEILSTQCLGEGHLPADDTSYPMFSLAIRYRAPAPFYPYVASIGKPDLFGSSNATPLYPTFAECLADLGQQTVLFERETGLRLVAATCESNRTFQASYALRLEGYSQETMARPKKSLYHFAPQLPASLEDARIASITALLHAQGAVIARQVESHYAYYRSGGVNLRVGRHSRMRVEECSVQEAHAAAMYRKAGAQNALVWCLPATIGGPEYAEMHVVHDGYTLQSDYGHYTPRAYSFQECLANRDLALSDSRLQHMLGGLCSESLMDDGHVYVLELFRKSW